MGHDPSCVALALKAWKTQIDRADKLFEGLPSEEVLRDIAPGRNRILYLCHLTAVHDAMRPLLGLRERLHPEFDVPPVSNPDRSRADIPSHEQVRGAWNIVNVELWKGFEKLSWPDWVQRHAAVSEEDFAKDASRTRFAVLLAARTTCPTTSASRCAHSRVIEREASELESSRPANDGERQ